MKVFFISPTGYTTPLLFDTFEKTFIEQGHGIVGDINEADCFFVDLHSHLKPLPKDLFTMAAARGLPMVFFDETDYGGMSKEVFDSKPYDILFGQKKCVYFMRKTNKEAQYPKYIYPYEKTKMNDFPLTTPDELFSRPYDIFFVGNESPQRRNVCFELAKHFGCDFELGKQKIPHSEWLNRARQSKLFLTADGGGFSDERPYQLITIAPMLRQKNNHLQAHPFTDCVNCLGVGEIPTKDEIEGIKLVLNDKEYLHEIYTEGVSHMKQYYNEEERALYILRILKENGIC